MVGLSSVGIYLPNTRLSTQLSVFSKNKYHRIAQIPNNLLEVHAPKHPKNYEKARFIKILNSLLGFYDKKFDNTKRVSIIVATARNASELLEASLRSYYRNHQALSAKTSPLTTGGFAASLSRSILGGVGSTQTVSQMCSSSLQAVATAYGLLSAKLTDRCIIIAIENPTTDYILEMMNSIQLLNTKDDVFPCRPFNQERKNSLVLGEAGVLMEVALKPTRDCLGTIKSLGFGNETANSLTGISENGETLQQSMQQALIHYQSPIDLILAHAPGTTKGDRAEYEAIQSIDRLKVLPIYSGKWRYGHSFGASGLLAMAEFLYSDLRNFPYESFLANNTGNFNHSKAAILNTTGFGAQSVSVVVEKV